MRSNTGRIAHSGAAATIPAAVARLNCEIVVRLELPNGRKRRFEDLVDGIVMVRVLKGTLIDSIRI